MNRTTKNSGLGASTLPEHQGPISWRQACARQGYMQIKYPPLSLVTCRRISSSAKRPIIRENTPPTAGDAVM